MAKHTLSRRAILAQLPAAVAATSATALTAQSQGLDAALFTAIETYRRADMAYGEATVLTDVVEARFAGRRITQADYVAFDLASEAVDLAVEALTEAVPASLAGVRALLACGLELESGGFDIGPIIEAVLRSPLLADVDGRNSDAWNKP